MRVARYEVPGKIRKNGPSRRDSNESSQVRSAWENKKERTVPTGRLIRSLPLVWLPQGGYCGQCSHLVFSVGLAAKSVSGAADDVDLQLSFLRTQDMKFQHKISLGLAERSAVPMGRRT
jgi:hypothetical protein